MSGGSMWGGYTESLQIRCEMTEKAEEIKETFYIARTPLLIPNGPGVIPSSLRIVAGQRFALDGTEPINVGMLLSVGAIEPYTPGPTFAAEETPKPKRIRKGGR